MTTCFAVCGIGFLLIISWGRGFLFSSTFFVKLPIRSKAWASSGDYSMAASRSLCSSISFLYRVFLSFEFTVTLYPDSINYLKNAISYVLLPVLLFLIIFVSHIGPALIAFLISPSIGPSTKPLFEIMCSSISLRSKGAQKVLRLYIVSIP